MFFLLNDVVLNLELQLMTPPMIARRFSALTLDCVQRLGRELYAEDPRLQHRRPERAKRLASLLVSKAPEVNAALFSAPSMGCRPERVAVRLAALDLQLLVRLYRDQRAGRLTPTVADSLVWGRAAAA
jgi:hypothetical protein